jgi:hypothetical protein
MQGNERPMKALLKYMLDVALGMHYISERGLVHRVSATRSMHMWRTLYYYKYKEGRD